jgi:flagellar basal-body rod protein FlgB
MLERLFDNQAYHDLKAALDIAAQRQVAIAQNIANADTPGYRRKIVTFDEELFAAVGRGEGRGRLPSAGRLNAAPLGPRHIPLDEPDSSVGRGIRIVEEPGAPSDESGSSVDLFEEMADQAENALRFDALSQLVTYQLTTLRKVIQAAGGTA